MKRKYIFLSNWDGHDLKCACLFFNPLCENHKKCEEIEMEINPYDDIEECMKARRYKKERGAFRQKG